MITVINQSRVHQLCHATNITAIPKIRRKSNQDHLLFLTEKNPDINIKAAKIFLQTVVLWENC